ncbi:conserved hypothetical protein [uncultured Mycobacterium sp.]|nr:conserved hypothetical protein [uncultured Mycobacterium sp.]
MVLLKLLVRLYRTTTPGGQRFDGAVRHCMQRQIIWRYIMAKRGRKKRDRKHSKANHGRRPNA